MYALLGLYINHETSERNLCMTVVPGYTVQHIQYSIQLLDRGVVGG